MVPNRSTEAVAGVTACPASVTAMLLSATLPCASAALLLSLIVALVISQTCMIKPPRR